MADATELPNPYTSLAFLAPALASQFEVSRYLHAATLGAYVWDIGLNLGNDYALLFKHRVRFPTIVYFLSRAFTLALILSCFVFQVASVENCNALGIFLGICLVLSKTATSMVFFLRVTALWHPSKIAYAVFSVLWIAVIGTCIIAPLRIRGAHIGPTTQCIFTAVPDTIELAAIMSLINDTAVFLAISYRILVHMIVVDSPGARLRFFFGGKRSSTLSQALLQSGQQFYLVAVGANVTVLAVFHLGPVIHSMLTVPTFALVNAMACLVFRKIKFGLISADGTLSISTIDFNSDFHATANPRSLSLHSHRPDPTAAELRSDATSPLDLHVQREIDKFEDKAEARREISKPTDLASVPV
ncbi:hypothetical protein MSAN_02381500 [Mycena sanguinolenta]|uniref:Uncharacterized protein n=1 Tax=Mycena sanguinolenta TaxID=230812 RepID=A0A8H6X4A3_9AGAR|nr:hypothetical protein MSAN_02381500 [Mycena sanguinolenta]